MDDLDMIMASLENGIGSIGGFVAGTSFVVEHQTLAGLGKNCIYDMLLIIKMELKNVTGNLVDGLDVILFLLF